MYLFVIVYYNKGKEECIMYVNITGSKNNKDVYIYQSFRKANGKPSSRIYKKLGKYNELLEKFSGNEENMMAWARAEAAKETSLYNQQKEQISVTFSQVTPIPWKKNACLTSDIFFCSSCALNCVLTTSAETSATVISSHTTFMRFSQI